jgi:hypothetical protein
MIMTTTAAVVVVIVLIVVLSRQKTEATERELYNKGNTTIMEIKL